MKHTENEIARIKEVHSIMWGLVEQQVKKAFDALNNRDKHLAKEIIIREKMVNTQELVVDSHCENFIALFAPVAVDLRFVLSLIKINNNLERIGDFAESIALYVLNKQSDVPDKELKETLQLQKMMNTALEMMALARESFDKENSSLANQVLCMDDTIDAINNEVPRILAAYTIAHPDKAEETFHLISCIRRIERIGDRINNIAEDVVFYIDAKEIRHKREKK